MSRNHWSALHGTCSVRYIFHRAFTCTCVNITLIYLAKLELYKATFLQEPAILSHSFSQKKASWTLKHYTYYQTYPFFLRGKSVIFFHLQIFTIKHLIDLCVAIQPNTIFTEKDFRLSVTSQITCRPAKLQPPANLMLPNPFPKTRFLSPYLDTFQNGHVSHKFPVKVQGSCRCSVLLINNHCLFFLFPLADTLL